MSNPKSKIQNSKFVSTLACAGLTVMVLWLALIPSASAPSGLGWDKLNHAGAIAVITSLAYLSLQPRSGAVSWAFLYGITLGILIEILQANMTTTRFAEWSDIIADFAGAGFAWIIIKIYQYRTAAKP
ncbi:MAG: hypothetical protein HGB32_05130 [Geobacteraceae bacterium]|nr:hypothetical protein [Geobacteraceae bacterium]NTW79513.1 hypothetical protein [Geobacteraceae bacterium]